MTRVSPLVIHPHYRTLCREVAARIAHRVREKPHAVLGLATGSTPIGVYKELIRLHREDNLDFSGVTCFNLDEYVPLASDAPQSYHRFMRDACRKMGAKPLLLDLPFYGDGAQRLPLGESDITRTLQMLEAVKPDLVLLTDEKKIHTART
jgi:hypothetical protein